VRGQNERAAAARHSRNSDSPRGELSELNRLLFFLRSAAFASTFAGTRMARFFPVRYRSFAPFCPACYSRPTAVLSFLFGRSTLFVAFLNMFSLPFLL
jgi:hypothetical protein